MKYLDRAYIHDLPPLTLLIVQTRNSSYRIVTMKGGNVCVDGGPFRQPITAHLDGAGVDGTSLTAGWIVVGLPMQIAAGGRRFLTSAVREIVAHPSRSRVIA